jgi:hypothetical protein
LKPQQLGTHDLKKNRKAIEKEEEEKKGLPELFDSVR